MNAFDYEVGDVLPIQPRLAYAGKWEPSDVQRWVITHITRYEARAHNSTWPDLRFEVKRVDVDDDDVRTITTYDAFTRLTLPVTKLLVTRTVNVDIDVAPFQAEPDDATPVPTWALRILADSGNARLCNVCTGQSPSWDGHDKNPPCLGYAREVAQAALADAKPKEPAQ